MQNIHQHEIRLTQLLKTGLESLSGVTVYGPPIKENHRAPTLSFSVHGKRPEEVCQYLAQENICAWGGHFYAIRAVEILGLLEKGGVTRMGTAIYSTEAEVQRTIEVMETIVK